jgi:toxin HigB-1
MNGDDDELVTQASEQAAKREAPPYRDKRTERFANGERVKEFQSFERQAKKRLRILLDSVSRNGLILLPSNHLEALGGDRHGQYSIRINMQWRICFEWPDGAPRPYNIEIVDYH